MTTVLRKLIPEYLEYFHWFLEGQLQADEVDYMLHLRDRIAESGGNLGDLDSVWRLNAAKMLKHKSVFLKPLTNAWWWKETTWLKLTGKTSATHRQKTAPRTTRVS